MKYASFSEFISDSDYLHDTMFFCNHFAVLTHVPSTHPPRTDAAGYTTPRLFVLPRVTR